MDKNISRLSALLLLILSCTPVLALPFSPFDPKSMAMGGAGVAVADPANAPFYNPALLTSDPSKKFSLELPIIGGRLYDPGNLHNNATTLQTSITSMTDSFTTVTNQISALGTLNAGTLTTAQAQLTTLQSNLTTVANNITSVNNQLSALSNQAVQAELGAAAVVSVPGKNYGFAFYGESWGAVGGTLVYNDATTLNSLHTTVATLATTLATVNTEITNCTTTPSACAQALIDTNAAAASVKSGAISPTLASRIRLRGVAINEAGFAFSRQQVTNDVDWSWGVTPKIMQLKMYDISINPSASIGNVNSNDYRATYSTLNFDVGLEKTFLNGWRSGLVVKNVLPQSFDFKNALTTGGTPVPNGATLNLQPQLRVGLSYQNAWTTLALDADLTRNNPAGLEEASQYVALGGELNTAAWTQIRAGYRADMVNNARDVASLGFGLSPRLSYFKPHFDFAITASPDIFANGWNAATQVGIAFKMGINY